MLYIIHGVRKSCNMSVDMVLLVVHLLDFGKVKVGIIALMYAGVCGGGKVGE